MVASGRNAFILSALFCIIAQVKATHKCVWVRGALQCHRDTSKQLNVEVRAYDRDGFSIFKALDPDDLMGVTFTEPDGTFQLDGCGDDFNWLPGLQNLPDPYIRIHHYCNSEHGETIELPEFNTFVPETYDLGIIVLDSKTPPNASVAFPPTSSGKFRRIQSSSSKGSNEETAKSTTAVDNTGEGIIFDVIDSRESSANKKQRNKEEKATTSSVQVTQPDQSNWEFPIELATGSQELAAGEQSKEKKVRYSNWTKQKQEQVNGADNSEEE